MAKSTYSSRWSLIYYIYCTRSPMFPSGSYKHQVIKKIREMIFRWPLNKVCPDIWSPKKNEWIEQIINEDLGMWKLCAKSVSCGLTIILNLHKMGLKLITHTPYTDFYLFTDLKRTMVELFWNKRLTDSTKMTSKIKVIIGVSVS